MGSESGRGERKQTEKPSTGIWKEGTGNQAGEKEETEEARAKAGTGKATVRRNREEKEKKKQRPSSEVLTRKRTKESGSQASAPEERSERGSPVEQLRERIKEGRKETISKAKYRNLEGRHEKSGQRERGNRGSESRDGHRESNCEAEPRREGKEEAEAE